SRATRSRKGGNRAVSEHLRIIDEPGRLRRPIMIMAFSGWNDAAESATTAARYLGQLWPSHQFATIDPEDFYHFGLTRPLVRFREGPPPGRGVTGPATEFPPPQPAALDSALVVGVASEPHLKWRTYCAAVLELARRCDVSLVLTLGALLAEVAHSHPVRLT